MDYFSIQKAIILGKEIKLCVCVNENVEVTTKGIIKDYCDILKIRTKCFRFPKKNKWYAGDHYLSIEAITVCTYLNYDLSNIENVNYAVSKKDDILQEYHSISLINKGDWKMMLAYMSGTIIEVENLHSQWVAEERDTRKEKWALSFFVIIVAMGVRYGAYISTISNSSFLGWCMGIIIFFVCIYLLGLLEKYMKQNEEDYGLAILILIPFTIIFHFVIPYYLGMSFN